MQMSTLNIDSLLKLAGTGSAKAIEDQWMSALDRGDVSPGQVAQWSPVLEELTKRDRQSQAETLAWSTIEALKEKYSPAEALAAAGAFLLKLGESGELRKQVTDLYRNTYSGRPGLDTLISEAGIATGRPPRRALRILDVGLNAEPGSCLIGRHDEVVVRVESVDTDAWQFTISGPDGSETLSALELADRFAVAPPDDVRVLRRFDPERLATLLESDPVHVVIGILKAHGGQLDSDALEHLLCPVPFNQTRWNKWWSGARAALKRSANVRVEGRAPIFLTYVDIGETLEDETLAKFRSLTHAADQLGVIEGYVRECRTRKQTPDEKLLLAMRDRLRQHADREHRSGATIEFTTRLLIAVIDQARGVAQGADDAAKLLADAKDPGGLVQKLEIASLWPMACDFLARAVGAQRAEAMAKLLPVAPQSACDDVARRLVEAGATAEQLESVVQTVLADPVQCFDALAWLWEGSEVAQKLPAPPPITLLTRVIGVLGDVQRRDDIPAKLAKAIQSKGRATLSARKYERFSAVLGTIEPGMAMALRTQIGRLDKLGRVVHEDLLSRIRRAFPELYAKPKLAAWQDDTAIFTTREGKARKEVEINELVNVKMKENAKAIGEAAARGDLSENSEYKFALEERDLLRARLAQMQDELSLAKLIEPDAIPTDEVGIGSRVTLKDQASLRTVAMTFLGPWDTSLERGIYNYRSPLGQSIMGRRVGDTVDLDIGDVKGTYIVDRIESALAEPA